MIDQSNHFRDFDQKDTQYETFNVSLFLISWRPYLNLSLKESLGTVLEKGEVHHQSRRVPPSHCLECSRRIWDLLLITDGTDQRLLIVFPSYHHFRCSSRVLNDARVFSESRFPRRDFSRYFRFVSSGNFSFVSSALKSMLRGNRRDKFVIRNGVSRREIIKFGNM